MEQGFQGSLKKESFGAEVPLPVELFPLLTSSDIGKVTGLYIDVFLADEPTSRVNVPDRSAAYQDARAYVLGLAENGLSFLARDVEAGGIAGFIFCFDLPDDPTSEGVPMAGLSRHFPETVSMLDELEDMYLERSGVAPGAVLHICQICVGRSYRGEGIATALIRQVIGHARKLGYRQVVAECTSAQSRRIFERCGFFERGYLAFDAFSYNGVCVFQELEGGISLMAKDVDPYHLDPSSED